MQKSVCRILMMVFVFCLGLGSAFYADASRISKFESDTLAYINKYRTSHGLAPLRLDMRLQGLAREHSNYMNSVRSLGHQNFLSRYGRSQSRGCAENVGWNSRTAFEQFTGWRDSSGHRKNMLDRTMKRIGVSKVGSYVTFFACM
jgi:uncharacterized protein YkwD